MRLPELLYMVQNPAGHVIFDRIDPVSEPMAGGNSTARGS
jgi:hypothetical protein